MCETVKLGESRHFDILNETLSFVDGPLSRIEINLECIGFTSVNDLDGLATVDFRL